MPRTTSWVFRLAAATVAAAVVTEAFDAEPERVGLPDVAVDHSAVTMIPL